MELEFSRMAIVYMHLIACCVAIGLVLTSDIAMVKQLLKADPNPVPVVGRDFSRADRLLVRVAAYGPAGTTPSLTAKLLNRAGQVMSEIPVAPPASPGARADIEMALGPLAAGEYVIEITAAGESGEAKELVAFRVIG